MEDRKIVRSPAGETYIIEEQKGRGATGTVYSARRGRDNRQVAIKFLHNLDYTAFSRFQREAWAYGHFNDCPYIVSLLDHDLSGTPPYLVEEFCVHGSGRDRLSFLRSQPTLTTALLIHVAVALETVHGRGCLYRDLKPDNLLLTAAPSGGYIMKLGDAGLICLPGEYGLPLATRNALGTVPYMAPELFRRGAVYTKEAEVFAFGVTACEMLINLRPTAGSLITSGPALLRGLLQRMIAADPALRPTIGEVIAGLQQAREQMERQDKLTATVVGGSLLALLLVALFKKNK